MFRWLGGISITALVLLFAWMAVRTSQESLAPVDVRLAVMPSPTNQLLRATKELGLFAEHDLRVELVTSEGETQVRELMRRGRVDGALLPLADVYHALAEEVDLKVVLVAAHSNGADGLVAREDISTVSDLAGKRIAVEKGSAGEVVVREALGRAELALSEVTIVSVSSGSAGTSAFLRDEVDAVAASEPFFGQVADRPGNRILFSSAAAPGLLPQVIVFREAFIAQHPDRVRDVLNAWLATVEQLTSEEPLRNEVLALSAIASGTTIVQQAVSLEKTKLFSFADNAVAFTHGDDIASLYGSSRNLYEILANDQDNAYYPADAAEFIDASFVRSGLR